MQIKVILDTGGSAAAGVDRQALVADIQAEVDKFASSAKVEAAKVTKTAPRGAQGDLAIIQWLIDFATDPEMAKVYARALIHAINAILQAAKSKQSKTGKKSSKSSSTNNSENNASVRITVFNKEVLLPAATKAIKAILDELGDK